MTKGKIKSIINAVVTLRDTVTDEQALTVTALYPEWRVDVDYEAGQRIMFNNILYKVLSPHKSQETWTPDIAPSLFAKVLVADPNVVSAWEQPGSTNGYSIGDKVQHNGKTWEIGRAHV